MRKSLTRLFGRWIGRAERLDHQRFCVRKERAIEAVLGKMWTFVGHAIIPFSAGGAVDMYYFPNFIPGTALATMEMITNDGSGVKPGAHGQYELVAFTRHPPVQATPLDRDRPFHLIERRFCRIFTALGRLGLTMELNPQDVLEIERGPVGQTSCLILDELSAGANDLVINGKKCCLLLCIEVHPAEYAFAKEHGVPAMIRRLREAGHYPYSDLDRPVLV